RGGHHALDALVALSFAAAATSRIRLQTNLFVPAYRHPLLSAKAIATLDVLSGGRVILGVGAGYLQGEFDALGADFDRRNDVLDEALVTMKAAWTGEPIDGTVCLPTPLQQPHPPVWVGGNSKRAIRRAVEHGNGWVPMPSPRAAAKALHTPGIEGLDDLRARIGLLHEAAAEAGRTTPIDIVFMPSGLDMFAPAPPPAASVVDELHALAGLGVSWATVCLPADGRVGLLRQVEAFGRDVIARLG
ncbi:MAG TPA: TIGR03619 family F420-dependent LLM class oxidoreductase, partial [Mycobacteriales bacterium]|nr:TIGR03619 family F420-dependent LLM class oxidoreductase [Mycobacteriales bacterium]